MSCMSFSCGTKAREQAGAQTSHPYETVGRTTASKGHYTLGMRPDVPTDMQQQHIVSTTNSPLCAQHIPGCEDLLNELPASWKADQAALNVVIVVESTECD